MCICNAVVLQVQSMIQQAMRDSPLAETQQQQQQPLLPLIRLRVDYSGFSTINSQRFGQKFVGKVRAVSVTSHAFPLERVQLHVGPVTIVDGMSHFK
jgi:hypothetical protein